uniref:HTH psq-type domain-containing protein n=1 Tax=Graphocephala atropunctata TaxID=36148 RepID=A0A1B6LCL4_9HEMI
MGRTEGKLPPSEALPGIGEHSVVFHNGTGFYYICKEYASELDKRLFECVRPECRVTAGMGEGCGSPLIDVGRHSHPPDLKYREKCILLHNIRRRLCLQEIPVMEILRDALASHQADSSGYATAGSSNDPLYEEPLGEELSDQVKVEMLEPLDVCESDNSEILSELTDFEEHKDEVVLSKAEPFTSLYLPEENMMETAEHEKESNRVPVFPVCLAEGEEMCYGRRTMRRKMKREIAKKSHQVLARKKNINNRWRQFRIQKAYPKNAIRMALEAIQDGKSIRGASKRFGVPEATVRGRYHRIQAEVAGLAWMSTRKIPEEEVIAERIKTIMQDGFPVSKQQLKAIATSTLVEMYANRESLYRYVPNNQWLAAFLRRYPEISDKLADHPLIESQLLDWFCNTNN